jgi:hypothetical protein
MREMFFRTAIVNLASIGVLGEDESMKNYG